MRQLFIYFFAHSKQSQTFLRVFQFNFPNFYSIFMNWMACKSEVGNYLNGWKDVQIVFNENPNSKVKRCNRKIFSTVGLGIRSSCLSKTFPLAHKNEDSVVRYTKLTSCPLSCILKWRKPESTTQKSHDAEVYTVSRWTRVRLKFEKGIKR